MSPARKKAAAEEIKSEIKKPAARIKKTAVSKQAESAKPENIEPEKSERIEPAAQPLEMPAKKTEDKRAKYPKTLVSAVKSIFDKKGIRPAIFNLYGQFSYTDYIIVAEGTSDRHVKTIADAVIEDAKKHCGALPMGVEGHGAGQWILIDFSDVVVHIMLDSVRQFYDIEGVYSRNERIDPLTLLPQGYFDAPKPKTTRRKAAPKS